MLAKLLYAVALLLFSLSAYSQYPVVDFSTPEEACKKENIILNNQSNDENYQWDFCEGDLLTSPIVNTLTKDELNIPVGVSLVKSKGNWYGFITSLNSNSLFRVDFGESLFNATPTVIDLGNLGGLLSGPQDIKIVEFEDSYYAFVDNRGSNKLIRINLGNNIETTTASSDVLVSARGFTNGGVDVAFDGNNWIAASTNSNTLTLVNLGNKPISVPSSSDIINTSAIPEANNIGDIKFVKDNGQWHGFAVCFGSKTVHRLTFGNNLFQDPIPTTLNTSELTNLNPYGLVVEKDNNAWVLLSSTVQGNIIRLNVGNDITNITPEYSDLGKLNGLRNTLKLDIAKSESRWIGLATNWNSKKFFLLEFPQADCSFNQEFSTNADTVHVAASEPGLFSVSLQAKSTNGLTSLVTKTIEILDTEAPIVSIDNTACFSNPIQFTTQTTQPLTSAIWTINSETRTGETVTYDFPTPGTYPVTLEVESANGCGNRLTKEITIYEPPVPNFTTPAGQVCTNGVVDFTNTTDAKGADADSIITYRWFVNDSLVSEAANPAITFAEGGAQTVRLEAGIPGCTETTEQVINVLQGPTVRFNVAQICQGEPIAFENLTTGESITGYAWDFGDGGTFSSVALESPTYTFAEAGTYTVALTASNDQGCQNVYRQEVTVFEPPRVGFLSEVACVGTPTQFTDTTTAGTNANVIAWRWDFGDGLGTAEVRNPTYAYPRAGTYDVKLITQTTAGCTDSVFQTVTVESPVAAGFSSEPQCSDDNASYLVRLTDTSVVAEGDAIDRWFWTVNGENFVSPEVTYAFPAPGTYAVSLTAFAASGCNATVTQTVRVDSLPQLAFTVAAGCTGAPRAFRSEVTAPGREITQYAWSVARPDGQTLGTAFEVNPSFTFDEPGPYAVTLTATTADGCSFATTQSVTVAAAPVATFTASPDRGGAPLEVTFENNTTDATQYAWEFSGPDGYELSTSAEANPTFTFSDVGSYGVTLIATNEVGCSSVAQQTIEVVVPTQDLQLDEIVVTESPTGSAQQVLLTVTNRGSLIASDITATVNLGEAVVVQETLTQSVPPGETVVYPLRLQLPDRPDPLRHPLRYLCVSLAANEASFPEENPDNNRQCLSLNQQLNVEAPFPNPARDELRLSVILPEPDLVALRLMNQDGKVLRQYRQAAAPAGLNTFLLNVKGMPAGAYLLQITYQGKHRQFRVAVGP